MCGDHQRLDWWDDGHGGMVGIKWVAVHKIGSSLAWSIRQRTSSVAWAAENKAQISFNSKGVIIIK